MRALFRYSSIGAPTAVAARIDASGREAEFEQLRFERRPTITQPFDLIGTDLHSGGGSVVAHAEDLEGIEAEEILKVRERLNTLIATETGQDLEKVTRDSDRNFWMDAEQARDYGLVGKVISSASELD